MKRKVVQQGASTLMVSLPSKWARNFNLIKGDEVEIEEFNDKLVLTVKPLKANRETILSFTSEIESAIRVAIINAYRAGYDIIKINFENERQYNIIQQVVNEYTLGLEITKKIQNSCRLENITEPSEKQFDILFSKIFDGVSLMIQDTENRLKDPSYHFDYEPQMIRTHKYDNFCRRVMARQGLLGGKASFYWNFLSILVHCPRELYHLNKYLDKNKVKYANAKLFEKFNELLMLIRGAYYNKDLTRIESLHELERDLIFKLIYSEIEKGGRNGAILFHLGASIRNLYLSNSPLIGIIIHEEHPYNPLTKN